MGRSFFPTQGENNQNLQILEKSSQDPKKIEQEIKKDSTRYITYGRPTFAFLMQLNQVWYGEEIYIRGIFTFYLIRAEFLSL